SGVLAAIIYLAIFVLQTKDGTIRIETNADFDGKVPLVIRQGDEVIKRLTVESQGVSTRVRAGSYSIDFDGEHTSFELQGTRATVKAGGVWIAKIDYQSNEGNDSWKALSDPSKVHQLANEDTRHGRYEAALDKVLWYWDNAVTIQPSQSAVRRSFLLSDWLKLGEAFPPALEKLKSIRDQLEASILSKNQVRVRSEDFADFAALNDTLRDEQRTVHVFKEIEARDPEDAKRLRYWLPDAVDGKPDVVDGAGIDIDTPAREGTPVAQFEEGLPLDEAVEQFNQKNIRKNLGFDQPPLTALEIVTCARWKLQTNTELTPETRAGLSTLATERQLPLQWTIEGGFATFPAGEREVKGFQIFLMDHSRDVAVFVRRRYLSSLPPSIAPSDLTPDPDAMPLASAITEFNAIHNTIDGVRQPPLTLDEVLAAIASWSSRRDEAPVDNATYEAFLNIAATRQLPHGVKFEVIPSFGSVTGDSFKVWSVRILMPLISKPGWTYAFSIREQYVGVDSIDMTSIYWGVPADNGLQAGVRLVPSQPEYRIGQRIGVEFFYRSTTGRAIEADLPNAFTFKEIKVVDGDGSELKAIDHQQHLVGGWMGTNIGEQPTRRIGQSIQISSSVPTESKTAVDGAHESGAGATILAEAGQTCRLRFLVRNYATEVGEPLPTGKVEFRVLGQAFIFRSPSN
ncbi:MAG: hypothetical protein KDA72_17555, partial [Planctomycetales bacterium]|nr:hypothetical protein [Planctomycetales bacterium]